MPRSAALILSLLLALPAGSPTHAEAVADLTPAQEILSALRSRGYVILENERTWLGRQRILAEKDGTRREVVFIPGTGEILRDYSVQLVPPEGNRLAGEGAVTVSPTTGGAVGVVGSADPAPGLSLGDDLATGRDGQLPDFTVGAAP